MSGGIGRHARLRILCRKVCGFESRLAHQPSLGAERRAKADGSAPAPRLRLGMPAFKYVVSEKDPEQTGTPDWILSLPK